MGIKMDSKEFIVFRKIINKTQKEMAQLVGTSVKAVHSYEQGWRKVPAHVERQMYFLLARKMDTKVKKCWTINKCPKEKKVKCPAFKFNSGNLC